MKYFLLFLCLDGLSGSLIAKTLPTLPNERSVELNVIPAHSISLENNRILTFVPVRDAILVTPFWGLKESREKSFGTFSDASKFFLKDREKNFIAHFGILVGEQIVAFDGEAMNVAIYSLKDKKFWRFRDLIYDLILPYADSGGEAPLKEKSSLRSKFLKEAKKKTGMKITHIRLVPESMRADKNAKSNEFLMVTRLKSARIVTVHCEKEDKARCFVKRKCPVSIGTDADINGVAFDEKRKILGIGMENSVEFFSYKNCNQISRKYSVQTPKDFPLIADIEIDDSARLWIATQSKDSKSHGSIFVWEKSEWNYPCERTF